MPAREGTSMLENDTAAVSLPRGTVVSFDQNPLYGRVAYTYGGGWS